MMWSTSEEPLDVMEGGSSEATVHTKETCEQNKNQLESLKEIMIKNQESLKKKEEEVQEYARRLSKIKSRAKLSRRSKEGASSPKDTAHSHKTELTIKETTDDTIDDISQAKTPKAKSSLLQRKLVENRKAFEQRNKELSETKRAVVEKVEAIRQRLDETDLAVTEICKDQLSATPIRPLVITSDMMTPVHIELIQEKENKIVELSSKILELEATILDLQENLKEKDSVIDSKMKAVTLMSADLSKKGKTTLDTLEDTKDEMRTMQENFVLIETSLKNKNINLLEQLQERDNRISELEHTIDSFEEQFKEEKIAKLANDDISRSTMDTLTETKDAMKSMQETFVLIESSLKLKNEKLLQQLEEYEIKLAEAKQRIFQLESGAGIIIPPTIEDLQCKIEKLEHGNRQLIEEKYELQKNIAELQHKIITISANNVVTEKDNKILELENLIEELKNSYELLKEESKVELQTQVNELSFKNEEYFNKITDLEKQIHEIQTEKANILAKLPDEQSLAKEDDKVTKLTKELDDLNKSMIKLKAQHRSKLKNLQKQLENFKMVSDTNAELIRLGNQVTLLEEEKGNLQLSLVDFDELKASAGDWQERVADLESKVSSQTKEIQIHIDAIATLENQKLDLMQELHTVKQEISALEAENAELENLRVTAEMKIVDLEEQLEAVPKEVADNKHEFLSESEYNELLKKIDILTQENSELYSKLSKMEEKGTSDTGSTESFEAIQVNDRNDLLKKVEKLEQKNNELTIKLTKLEEKDSSHAGSTESFETINDTDRNDLLKKIEQLTQENSELTMKLSRIEEKGSSDTGSTESFERIPEHNENITKIELLTQENSDLVIKLTKLEEQLSQIDCGQSSISNIDSLKASEKDDNLQMQIEIFSQKNDDLMSEISKLRAQIDEIMKEKNILQDRIETLMTENVDLNINRTDLENRLQVELSHTSQMSDQILELTDQINALTKRQQILEIELTELREASAEQSINITCESDESKSKIVILEGENAQISLKVLQLEEYIGKQKEELNKIAKEKEELNLKLENLGYNDLPNERMKLVDELEKLNQEKENLVQEKQELYKQISTFLQKSSDETSEIQKVDEIASQESQITIIASLEQEVENSKVLIAEYKNQIQEMNMKLQNMEVELQEKARQLIEYEASGAKLESLECELKDMLLTAEEWKFKYDDMQVKMQILEEGKASIEEAFETLENGNKELLEMIKEKDAAVFVLQEQFRNTVRTLESQIQDEVTNVTAKEHEITNLKIDVENKDRELHIKYTQLQNEMIAIDNLQEELNSCSVKLKENEATISLSLEEITKLNDVINKKEEEICSLRNNATELNKVLEESKSLLEFNELSNSLQNKETKYITLQNKYDEILERNDDLSKRIEILYKQDIEITNELTEKQEEITSLLATKEDLNVQIKEIKSRQIEAEERIYELQSILDNQSEYIEKLRSDLKNEYKQADWLKKNHTEEVQKMEQRFQEIMDECLTKMQENDTLKDDLKQKEELLNKNFTDEMKITLENRIVVLEENLLESEHRFQMQSVKMKKIVATFNKKKVVCQELEARVVELQEKWTMEKDEKEAKNKKIQEMENLIQEKGNNIADLEEKLIKANNYTAEILANSEKLTKDSISLKEKMAVMMDQITEMGEEIEKQRTEIERISLEVVTERTTKEDIVKEYEFYKQTTNKENEQKQVILDEVKEEARELSVRMQVMEMEYVERLALIKNLQAENGLLSSKQIQINEKLENAEKESEERRVLIEQLQKDITTMVNVAIQVPEGDMREDDALIVQHCHSEQCQNLVQTLETRLQQRHAEIENLHNELATTNFEFMMYQDQKDEHITTTETEYIAQSEKLHQEINILKMKITEHEPLILELEAKLEGYKNKNIETTLTEQRASTSEAQLEEFKCKNAECQTGTSETVEFTIISKQHQQQDDSPQLFDASKIFGATTVSNVDTLDKQEVIRLQILLKEQEDQCSEYIKEIDLLRKNVTDCKLHITNIQDDYSNAQIENKEELKKLQNLLSEKNEQLNLLTVELNEVTLQTNEAKTSQKIDSLTVELNSVKQQMSIQLQEHADTKNSLQSEILIKDEEIATLKTELSFKEDNVKQLMMEQDQQNHTLELYKFQINQLEIEVKDANDNDLMQEWEQRISAVTTERDLLQLQVNDLTESLEELKKSLKDQSNLQVELENAFKENNQALICNENSMKSLEGSRHLQQSETCKEDLNVTQQLKQVCMIIEEPISQPEHSIEVQSAQTHVEQEIQKLDAGSNWNNGSSEKLNVDEESWGWDAEDTQLSGEQHLCPMTLIPNDQLRAQVEDLQEKIKALEAQNTKTVEENKVVQVKCAKLVKKLKEYKIQTENLQQQLKTQKQTGTFFNLDTAIEEELKAQIVNLEKTINDVKEEKKNVSTEKDALLKRFDVVMSANERYLEMKEKQDMEIEVLRIQNKELGNKVQSLEWQLHENTTVEDSCSLQHENKISYHDMDKPVGHSQSQKESMELDFDMMSKKYKEEIDDLKDEMEALAAENEQLQHFLEEQKTTMSNLGLKGNDNIEELMERLNTLGNQNTQLQDILNKSKEEYDILRKQYEQSLIDANEQVITMRQNNNLLNIEFSEKTHKLEEEINDLRQQVEMSDAKTLETQKDLQQILKEKDSLKDKSNALSNSEEKLSVLNTSLMEVTELLNARVQEVADLKQDLQSQYIERQQAEGIFQLKIQNLIKELDEKKQELRTLNQTLSNKESEMVQQRSVETVSAIVNEASEELVQKHAIEIEKKDKFLNDLKEKLMISQLMVDEYMIKLQDTTTDLETQKQQITYLREDLIKKDSIIEVTKIDINLFNEKLQEKQQKLTECEEEKNKLAAEINNYSTDIQNLQSQLNISKMALVDLQKYNSNIHNLEQEIQTLKSERETSVLTYNQNINTCEANLKDHKEQIDALKYDLREKTEQLHYLNTQLCIKESDLNEIVTNMNNKDSLLETLKQELKNKQAEFEKMRNEQPQNSKIIDGLPVFRMSSDHDTELQSTIDELKMQMEIKQEEIKHLKYILSENTYPTIIQEMQDRINCLYNEKVTLESSLQATTQTLTEKQEQVNLLMQCINEQNQQHISKEELNSFSRERRIAYDQEEIVKLQNELHTKEQEINELKYIIAEKDSQLSLQASMEPQSDDFELRESMQRLMGEMYCKEQEIQTLKLTMGELQEEILRFKNLEKLSEESRNAIEKLTSEKEQIRLEAEELLDKELQKKQLEIDEIKQKLSEENQNLLAEFNLKDNEIDYLKTKLQQLQNRWNSWLQEKDRELSQTLQNLEEKDSILASLSITKDAELQQLNMQIHEKDARIEELLTLSAEEEKQLDELRYTLTARETEVNTLKDLLEQKMSEYALLQNALKKDVSVIHAATHKDSETVQPTDNKEAASSELDLALYMLHQRDVRCEELTHELMQLLEERDTLQLRLSNAIRVNEELRRTGNIESNPIKDASVSTAIVEPVVEHPSPSKSEGPIEIAKEAIDTPIEDQEALALKLSELHSVSHTKDVRLKDERELRHTQQMSLLAHRDVLSTLPPEAAARLINANYTLSRDVQSQSSVLLNWLWGKSTPKVMHM